jgi:glycosyltransferase involved in cell wall biosynthesis
MAEEPSVSPSRPLAAYYDEHYYAHYSHGADTPYRRDEPVWMSFFGEVARQILVKLAPRTVLDAGCAMGLLVEALRDRGVEAWGIDASSYAIDQVRDDARSFCRVGSITEELDRGYDLIACIEVLEHLPAGEGERAIANFARHTDCVLLSSTPDDYREPTHVNVQPPDYWVGLFARYGFFRDLDFDADFVSGHAILFRKAPGAPTSVIRAYERRYWQLHVERRELRAAQLEAAEAHAGQASEIEHLHIERELLFGEVVYWQQQNDLVDAEALRLSGELARLRERAEEDGQPDSSLPPGTARACADWALALWRSRRPGPQRGTHPSEWALETSEPVQRIEAHVGTASSATDRRRSVLFISDGADGPRRYRCDHQAESLRLLGWSADVITYGDASLAERVDHYAAFVLQRIPYRPHVEWLMQRARQTGKPVIYDTDDYIFDPRAAHRWAPSREMSEGDRRLAKHGMWRNREALRRADAVIVATEPLRKLVAELHQRVTVSPNAVSQAMLSGAEATLAARSAGHEQHAVTLAYLSGSATHSRDFAEIAAAVHWALDSYPAARLLIVGPLDLPREFARFGDRVAHLALQSWQALPSVLARVSVNLAPLESENPFTAAKSCVKYLEASLLGVPTIASRNHDYERVIREGDNGFLADSTEAWKKALGGLIESPEARATTGGRALEDVRRRHTTASRGHQLQALIDELIVEREHPGEEGKLRDAARSRNDTSRATPGRLLRLRLSAERIGQRLLRL